MCVCVHACVCVCARACVGGGGGGGGNATSKIKEKVCISAINKELISGGNVYYIPVSSYFFIFLLLSRYLL